MRTLRTPEQMQMNSALKVAESHLDRMTEGGACFVRSLRKHYTRNKSLTPRQMKALEEIINNI